MKKELGDRFSLDRVILAELSRRTHISRSKLRSARKHGFVIMPNGNKGRKKRPFLPAIQQSLILIFLEVSPTQFFDLIDRRYGKEGPHTIIFTSNKQPNEWHEYFLGMDDLMCSLDRIFDKASILISREKATAAEPAQHMQ